MSDDLDPILEGDEEELLLKKKRTSSDDDLDDFGNEIDIDALDEEDPLFADLGFGFGGADDDNY